MPAGVSAWTPLANLTLSGSASTVTFSSISGSYRHLVLVLSVTTSTGTEVRARFNGDTGSNYPLVQLLGNGSSASSFSSTYDGVSLVVYSGTSANNQVMNVLDYSATDKHKTVLVRNSEPASGVTLSAQRWANTAAITSMVVYLTGGTFQTGSTFALYGVSS